MNKSSENIKNARSANNEAVQVIVRCRPISEKEKLSGCCEIVDVYPNRGVIEVKNPRAKSDNERIKMFTYDAVYDSRSSQQCLYDEMVRPLVASVLEGYNGCVFAYGQTGTGKTHTMEGVVGDSDMQGIIPRAFEQIWSHINRTTGVEFLVYARYLELYMEDIRDLLKSKSKKQLVLREMAGGQGGVYVTHLHSQTCKNAADMMKTMRIGNKNRTTGVTNMNEHSSRSHAIFQIAIEMAEENNSKSVKIGKLNLVDLAGSERQSKTGASGDRLKEATKINKALSSLGNVIYALAENSSHVPYRDSKLTRLLQDSLGGNSKTIMIANIGPADMNYEETIITLRYAYRAKAIKNKPIKNEDMQDAKLLALQQEIERLKQLIAEKANGRMVNIEESEGSDDELDLDDSDDEELKKEKKEKEHLIELGKMEVDDLNKKLRNLEKQMVQGGKNIVESVNENEMLLEQQRAEIAARKKREIEMQQKLESEEENYTELRQVFTNLQQEVEFKREKLKRLHGRLQSLRQEIKDSHDEYIKNRQELVDANEDLTLQLRRRLLVLENFVPAEERSRLLNLAQFDENTDNWILKKETVNINAALRPRAHNYRRPISDYAIKKSEASPRYRGENVIELKLDLPLRTTQNYLRPAICPQVKAAVKNVIKHELDNNKVVVKIPPHGFSVRGISKIELEGRYNKAARNTIEVHNNRNNTDLLLEMKKLPLLTIFPSTPSENQNIPYNSFYYHQP
ncbi:kinesin-like protein Klp68D isoform X1 [Agrilus planipennis]|uniref:Kinesin-like protein n=1 Tax=Agrilus planipennis TaxID=224129 RepID=A0A7F5RA23_AGRPL|nr:kinesin-like protein Klp68D isoform X1 [Agrilus planipennis]